MRTDSRPTTPRTILAEILQDLAFAVRHFSRTPLLSLTVIAVLALGIGVNTATFIIVHSMLTSAPPGVPRDESVVRLTAEQNGEYRHSPRSMTATELAAYQAATTVFETVDAETSGRVTLTDAGVAGRTPAVARFVTPTYWKTLGLASHVSGVGGGVVLSHRFWERRFNSDKAIVGRTLVVNGVAFPITGIAPERFEGLGGGHDDDNLWLPMSAWATVFGKPGPANISSAVARLRAGVRLAAAAPIVAAIGERPWAPPRDRYTNTTVIDPLLAEDARSAKRSAITFAVTGGIATLVVLLITCANVAALLIGRAMIRQREIAVRLALGASRFRVMRQLLVESAVLALAAAGVVIVGLVWLSPLYREALPGIELSFDWPNVAFTIACALGTSIVFGQAPASYAGRAGVAESLKRVAGGTGRTKSGLRAQRSLVISQVALTQPLLLGLALTIVYVSSTVRDRRLAHVEEQVFTPELRTVRIPGDTSNYADREARFVRNLLASPAIDTVYYGLIGMFGHTVGGPHLIRPHDGRMIPVDVRLETPDYFAFMSIPFVIGGPPATRTRSRREIALGEDVARELWGTASPLGQTVRIDDEGYDVVGVIPAQHTLGPVGAPSRVFASPIASQSTGELAWVRGRGPKADVVTAIREAADAVPGLTLTRLTTLREERDAATLRARRLSALAGLGGVIILVLASLGLYAVVQLSVTMRRREIGVRVSLGATPRHVVGELFRQGARLGVIGLLVGLGLSVAAVRVIGSQDPTLASLDRPVYEALVALTVVVITALATWLPARAAAKVDPIVVLQAE